jgi:hypothetical protein
MQESILNLRDVAALLVHFVLVLAPWLVVGVTKRVGRRRSSMKRVLNRRQCGWQWKELVALVDVVECGVVWWVARVGSVVLR